jgi:hypothetical protein
LNEEIEPQIESTTTTNQQVYEIQFIEEEEEGDEEEEEPSSPAKVFKISSIQTRSQKSKSNEISFEEVKKDEKLINQNIQNILINEEQSIRSFDFDVIEVENTKTSFENETEIVNLRDPEDEDFPAAEALRKIPTKLIKNGALLYKGKQLVQFLSIFYNTKCKVCDQKPFATISDLFHHYRTDHVEIEPFVQCCSTKLTKMQKIIWHFVKHIEPEAFKCSFCNYAVSRPKFLAIHQQTHLPENEKPLECDL